MSDDQRAALDETLFESHGEALRGQTREASEILRELREGR